MTRTIGRATVVAALLSVATTAAMAQPTGSAPNYGCPLGETKSTSCVNGGGSSLAAFVYAAPATTTPVFAGGEMTQYAASTGGTTGISYVTAGSGAGQKAFALNDPSQYATGIAVDAYTVHFGASDAFVDANSSLFPYVASSTGAVTLLPTGGRFIQIPMFATPIAITVNNAKMTANGKITLKDDDLCGIFSGKLTNWNQTSAHTQLTAGTIHVYWRADNGGSGTTYLLTQHLAKVCTTANTATGITFAATTKFATLFPGYIAPATSTSLWGMPPTGYSNFIAANHNGGVADGVNNDATNSAIGFNSPDYTAIAATPATTTAPKPYTSLFVAKLLNAANNIAYLPSLANVTLAITNPGAAIDPTPPTGTALAAGVQTSWVPQIPQPASGYPIVGYTNLMFAQCYKSVTVANSLKGFLTKHINGVYKTLLNNNGFVPMLGTSKTGFGLAISNVFLNNTKGYNLNIGNTTACGALTTAEKR